MVEETIAHETDGKAVNPANRVFSVEILRLIRDAQKQHGLRHGDYQRYRGTSSKGNWITQKKGPNGVIMSNQSK